MDDPSKINIPHDLGKPSLIDFNGQKVLAYQVFNPELKSTDTKTISKEMFRDLEGTDVSLPPLIRIKSKPGKQQIWIMHLWVSGDGNLNKRTGLIDNTTPFEKIDWKVTSQPASVPGDLAKAGMELSKTFIKFIDGHKYDVVFEADRDAANQILRYHRSSPIPSPPVSSGGRTNTLIGQLNENFHLAKDLSLDTLRKLIKSSEESYYNELDDPDYILDDKVYDYIKDMYHAKMLEQGIDVTAADGMGHVPEPVGRLLKLPVWLGGMDKLLHGSGELALWAAKYPGPYVVSAKMDGASALLFREDGIVKMYSRGRKGKAQNISELLQYLNLPALPEGVMIRGELIMKKSVFAAKYKRADPKIKIGYRNIRNAVGGLVNKVGSRASGSKSADQPLDAPFIQDLEFITYEVITTPPMKCSDQYAYLDATYGTQVAPHAVMQTVSDEVLSVVLDNLLESMDYEIDGLIMCDDHIHERPYGENFPYIKAYKKPLANLMGITTIIGIEWNPSKDRLIKPVGLVHPLELDGTTIERVTLYNARYVVENNLGPGAVVELVRSGGVIPKVVKVIQPSPTGPSLPENYPYLWNDNKVEIVLNDDDVNSPANREVVIKRLYYFLKTIEAKGIGEETVAKMYDIGVRTIPHLLQLTAQHLAFMGPKASQNAVDAIQKHAVNIPLPILAKASGVFGRGFGERIMDDVFETYPSILESQEVQSNNIPAITQAMLMIPGFADTRATQIAEGFYKFLFFLRDMQYVGYQITMRHTPPVKKIVSGNHPLRGANVVFTGFTKSNDAGISNFLDGVGGNVQSSVTGTTTMLIALNPSSSSGKTKSATAKGIPIISKDAFVAKYMG